MAEARAEEDDERLREAGGARRSAAEHSDRNKPDQRHSSAGPLSSIRAAIKRTSTRTSSQSDHHRDRRRPEITILSAEPLPSNTWFPGASGAFPPAPPPAPPSWSAASGTVQLPPPTYEQVIKEKTREQILHSTSLSSSTSSTSPPSSRRSTSTIATQTDTDSPDPQSTAACSVRKPPKPLRPSFPQTSPHIKPFIDSGRSNQPGDAKPQTRDTPCKPEQRDAQSDFADVASGVTLLDSAPTATAFTQSTLDFSPDPVKEEQSVHPRPRPRPRSRASLPPIISEEILDQPMTREVKVQTLVRLKDDGPTNVFAGFSDNSSNFSSKYLQDLLDVFGSEEASFYDDQQQSKEKKEDETVISAVPSEPINRPQPRPRTQKAKPPLAPKPCILETEETGGSTAKPNLSKQTSSPPVAAPRPLLNQYHSPSDPSRDSLSESASHEHPMEDFSSAEPKDSSEVLMKKHPTSPEKTAVNLSDKNIINRPSVPRHTRPPPPLHRSVSFTSQVAGVTVTAASLPPLPPRPSGGRLLPLRPPPIKMTKPTGPSSSSAAANQLSESKVPKRGPPLPPRPKSGHPLYKSYSRKVQAAVEVEDTKELQEEPFLLEEEQLIVLDDTSVLQTQPDPLSDLCSTPEVKGEDVPVCGDLLEDSSADAQIHSRCVARFAFLGEEGELTFSEGDVITLIEYVNEEWGHGCMNGQIGIFPLSFIKEETDAFPRKPALASSAAGGRNRGRALHDFSPECEDELCLKAGDVVCDLEDMDAEWFLGEFGGKRGIIPKNYIQVLPEP